MTLQSTNIGRNALANQLRHHHEFVQQYRATAFLVGMQDSDCSI